MTVVCENHLRASAADGGSVVSARSGRRMGYLPASMVLGGYSAIPTPVSPATARISSRCNGAHHSATARAEKDAVSAPVHRTETRGPRGASALLVQPAAPQVQSPRARLATTGRDLIWAPALRCRTAPSLPCPDSASGSDRTAGR